MLVTIHAARRATSNVCHRLRTDAVESSGEAISKELRKCRAQKEFVKYAEKKGATVFYTTPSQDNKRGSQANISVNGRTVAIQTPKQGDLLQKTQRKEIIKRFLEMGIAACDENHGSTMASAAETWKDFGIQMGERDNKTLVRHKAAALDQGHEVSKQLMKCRTTKDFIQYAKRHNAEVVINSNHVKVSKNGTTTGFQSPGRKEVLHAQVRKQKIDAFRAMGIAWEK